MRKLVLTFISTLAFSCGLDIDTTSQFFVLGDVCHDKDSSVTAIQAARSGQAKIYRIDRDPCQRNKAEGLSLQGTGDKQPVVILYTPEASNLTTAQEMNYTQGEGFRRYDPTFSGTINREGQKSYVEYHDPAQPRLSERQQITLPGATQSYSFSPEAFVDQDALDLRDQLERRGVPVLLVNGHDSNENISNQAREFLRGNDSTFTVVDIGHGIPGENGKLITDSGEEVWPDLDPEDARSFKGPEINDVQHEAADKINAIFSGSERPGYCISVRCFSGSLADDGLDPKVKELVTFANADTVAFNDKQQNDLLAEFLSNQEDQNGDGQFNMRDLQDVMYENRNKMEYTIPKYEVRPTVFNGEKNDQPFTAVERNFPEGTPRENDAVISPEQEVWIAGTPATYDVKKIPVDVNSYDNMEFYERGNESVNDEFQKMPEPRPKENPSVPQLFEEPGSPSS